MVAELPCESNRSGELDAVADDLGAAAVEERLGGNHLKRHVVGALVEGGDRAVQQQPHLLCRHCMVDEAVCDSLILTDR